MANDTYATIYREKLNQYNTLTIYNDMLETGTMKLNVDGYPISYEDFKASNFISVMPRFTTQAGVAPGSPISTLFGATGTRNVSHTGLDFAVPQGTPERAFLTSEETSIALDIRTNGGEKFATGNYFTLDARISYVYKGELVTEDIYQAYLHQSKIFVEPSQGVSDSDGPLGLSGNTGYWNGPYKDHLHYDMFTSSPSPYLDLLAKQENPYGFKNKTERWDRLSAQTRYHYNPMMLPGFPTYPVRKDAAKYDR
jgi:hypothetical protein